MLALRAPWSNQHGQTTQQSHGGRSSAFGYLSGSIDWWREAERGLERVREREERGGQRGSLLLSVLGHQGLEEVLTQTHFSETDSSI